MLGSLLYKPTISHPSHLPGTGTQSAAFALPAHASQICRQHVAKGVEERDGHPCDPEDLWLTDGASVAVRGRAGVHAAVNMRGAVLSGRPGRGEGAILALHRSKPSCAPP